MDLLGRSINHYHITEQLGEGGMAIVYKAFDTHLERDVAVKVIRTDQFAPAILEKILKRFEREAKVVGKLSHPNIVGVIDYGEFEGSPYLVMPYLDGGTLKSHLIQHGRLPWQEAVRLLLPVADALQYAHEHNVLHRDVKPSNILLTDAGQPMLTDFGVAKVLEGDEGNTLTGTGVGLGTPEYMAPEQWQGQFSAQSDIYSLGVVLYEMVTGGRPYTADTPAAILIKQITGPLRQPRDLVPDLPENVERLLYKALAIKPEDRYEDMRSFVGALNSLLAEHTIDQKLDRRSIQDAPGRSEIFVDSTSQNTMIEPDFQNFDNPLPRLVQSQENSQRLLHKKEFWIGLTIMFSGWVLLYFSFSLPLSSTIRQCFGLLIGFLISFGLSQINRLNWFQFFIIMLAFGYPFFILWGGLDTGTIQAMIFGLLAGFGICAAMAINYRYRWYKVIPVAILWLIVYVIFYRERFAFTLIGVFITNFLTLLIFGKLRPHIKVVENYSEEKDS